MNSRRGGYLDKLRDFWFPDQGSLLWLLFGLPALYFMQTTIHEGAHAVTAWFDNGALPKFAPFPHLTPEGRFLNGVTLRAGGFIATPQFLDLALIVLLALFFIIVPLRGRAIRFALRMWFLSLCIDLLYNTSRELVGGHNRFADWSRFQDRFAISDGAMIALTWAIWLIVFSHFGWVAISAWHRYPPERSGVRAYRWASFILGLISLIAVVVSLVVRDGRVVKVNAAFIVPFVVQIISFVGHTLFFLYAR